MSRDQSDKIVDLRDTPESLSDRQLIEACRLVGWERRLYRFTFSALGCASSLVVAAGLVTLACYLLIRPLLHSAPFRVLVPAGLLVAGLLFLSLAALAERRRKRYWTELRRRYAGAELGEYIAQVDAKAKTAPQATPDTVVVLCGAALPHGGNWLVRVRLSPNDTGIVESRKLRPGCLTGPDGDDIKMDAAEAALSADECRRVRQAIAAVSRRRTKVFSAVYDGAPASLGVWERGRGLRTTAHCNLAGVPRSAEGKPAVCLMRLVMELGQRPATQTLVVGSYHPLNNEIRIGGA